MLSQCARISRLPATLLALPSANPRFATPLQSHAYECLDKQVQSNDILTNYRGGTPLQTDRIGHGGHLASPCPHLGARET
jgi:hypothetical protein